MRQAGTHMSTSTGQETVRIHSEAERLVTEALTSLFPRLPARPGMDTLLKSGLGLDELDRVELQLSLEDRCGVVLPNGAYDACHSLSEIARLLEEVMAEGALDQGC